jgi:hypothetical protein
VEPIVQGSTSFFARHGGDIAYLTYPTVAYSHVRGIRTNYVRLIPFEWDPSVTRPCSVAFGRVRRVQWTRSNAFTCHGISRPNSAVYGRRFTRTNTVPVDDRPNSVVALQATRRKLENARRRCSEIALKKKNLTSRLYLATDRS